MVAAGNTAGDRDRGGLRDRKRGEIDAGAGTSRVSGVQRLRYRSTGHGGGTAVGCAGPGAQSEVDAHDDVHVDHYAGGEQRDHDRLDDRDAGGDHSVTDPLDGAVSHHPADHDGWRWRRRVA